MLRLHTYEYRTCEVCGREFYVSKKSLQRFCSAQCQHQWQRGNTGYDNPKFQGGTLKCENCGKEYLVGGWKLSSHQHHFCSTACRQQWYARIWSQSSEWRDKSRRRAVKQLSENPATVQTKPQLIVNDILDDLSVEYINEYPMVYYSIDNYLPQYNLVVEVMGDYWHCSPLKYPEATDKKQQKSISRDKAKRTFLRKQYGINILYLWEDDILHRRNICVALIKRYIFNNGELENYHSFNYELDTNQYLVLKNTIIRAKQDEQITC